MQQTNSSRQIYEEQKQLAILLEKTNNSRIIVFPSIPNKNGEYEWYKIGGNSAYFYKYIVAPRLGKKSPTIHPDTDLNRRFKDGVILVHWIDTLINNLKDLNYKSKNESGLIIFDLNHTFTTEEIQNLKQLEKTKQNHLSRLFRPKNADPTFFSIVIELSRIIPLKAERLKSAFKPDYASAMNQNLLTIRETYQSYANGRLDEPLAFKELYRCVDNLNAILAILIDNNCLDLTSQARLGRLLADLESRLDRGLNNGK